MSSRSSSPHRFTRQKSHREELFADAQTDARREDGEQIGISEERRATLHALELAATLGHYERSLDLQESTETILAETAGKLRGLAALHSMMFFMVDDETFSFEPAWCSAPGYSQAFIAVRDALIDDHSFAWALGRNKPTVVALDERLSIPFASAAAPAKEGSHAQVHVMLHPLVSSSGAQGMFFGILDEQDTEATDIGYYLLTVVLFSAANMLENYTLYQRIARSRDDLEVLVTQRTRALSESNEQLQHEVTERRQAEQALRRTLEEKEAYRQNLEAVFTSMQDAILTVDRERRLISMNRAGELFAGIQEHEAVGHLFATLFPDCADVCMQVFERTLDHGQSVREFRARCRIEGADKVLTLSCSPLITTDGLFSGAVLIVRDITRLDTLERELRERHSFRNIIGRSQPMLEVFRLLENLADVDSTVLVLGESGTGKELVAEALHHNGARAHGPLVKVNCTALSENLLESELFGHVRGAFTGAVRDKAGRFEAAEGGTIFLDEIGDISLRIQVLLLRFLESKEFERVGDTKTRQADVRIVAATNADLPRKVQEGSFRADLFYRLNVMNVSLPPLRQRRDDIPLLIEHLIESCNTSLGTQVTGVSDEAHGALLRHTWPGNVRELKHTLEHGCILARAGMLEFEHLTTEVQQGAHDDERFVDAHGAHGFAHSSSFGERGYSSENIPPEGMAGVPVHGSSFAGRTPFSPPPSHTDVYGLRGSGEPETQLSRNALFGNEQGENPSGQQVGYTGMVPRMLTAQHIVTAIQQAGGNKTRAAKLLGIGRATLYRKMNEMGLNA